MEHRILKATAHPDFTLDLVFEGGEAVRVDLRKLIVTAEVTEPLRRDPKLFTDGMRIEGDGDWLSWPGDIDVDADALWYKAHPEDLERDFGGVAA
jgi:hypothetical protein